jgi:hypothetical protein
LYEKVHELVWIKLNESKCTVKQWNFLDSYFTWHLVICSTDVKHMWELKEVFSKTYSNMQCFICIFIYLYTVSWNSRLWNLPYFWVWFSVEFPLDGTIILKSVSVTWASLLQVLFTFYILRVELRELNMYRVYLNARQLCPHKKPHLPRENMFFQIKGSPPKWNIC